MVVVANRLPFDLEKLPDGSTRARQAPGGLVTALAPILSRRQGAWIGWPGPADVTLEPTTTDGLSLHPVTLTSDEVDNYYEGFSNETLWPLYHDAVVESQFHRDWWESYQRVNDGSPRRPPNWPRPARPSGCTTISCSWFRSSSAAPAGRPDRLLPAHPVPAGGTVHAAALADPDRAGPAGRRPDRLSTARRGPQLRPAGRSRWPARSPPAAPSSTTAGPSGPAPTRSRSIRRSSPRWPPRRAS